LYQSISSPSSSLLIPIFQQECFLADRFKDEKILSRLVPRLTLPLACCWLSHALLDPAHLLPAPRCPGLSERVRNEPNQSTPFYSDPSTWLPSLSPQASTPKHHSSHPHHRAPSPPHPYMKKAEDRRLTALIRRETPDLVPMFTSPCQFPEFSPDNLQLALPVWVALQMVLPSLGPVLTPLH